MTGIADKIGQYIGLVAGTGEQRLIFVLMVAVAGMSAFMNNIGATAVLLPVAISLSKKSGVSVSKLLIPLAFGSLLGGVTTLIGTPPNLLASAALADAGLQPFSLFDYTPMGLIILVSSILYMVFIGRHLLPDHGKISHATAPPTDQLFNDYDLQNYFSELRVGNDSSLIGKTIAESALGWDFDLTVMGVLRDGRLRLGILPNAHLRSGDIMRVNGPYSEMIRATDEIDLSFAAGQLQAGDLRTTETTVAEIVVSQKAHWIGQTLKEIDFRGRYGLSVLGIWREEGPVKRSLADISLKMGDTLLVHGRRERIEAVRDDLSFLLLRNPEKPNRRLKLAPLNLIIFITMITLVTTETLHIAVAAVLGAVLSVLTGCISMDEAYESIEWKSVFLIAGMLPMGIAMEKTGTAQLLADTIINITGSFGPRAILFGLFILTTLITSFMSNAAAAVLVAPIAISAALELNVDPRAFVMGVGIAASNAFLFPIGHQSCILVYGPGGYRFFDFTKVGLPLTLLIWALLIIFLPIFWPI
jgi:di/tricarboxylate transporter